MADKHKVCKHCGKPIVYYRPKRMWAVVDGRQTFFYCPQDPNLERCQHIPRKEASDGR